MTVVTNYTAILTSSSWETDVLGAIIPNHPVFISYSFSAQPQSYLTFGATYSASFQPLTEAEKAAARQAFAQWDAASGIRFIETAAGTGDIQIGIFNFDTGGALTSSQAAAYTFGPGTGIGGDLFLSSLIGQFIASQPATYLTSVFLHEIGHAIGFKHVTDGSVTLDPSLDANTLTVMADRSQYGTLGSFDLSAVSYLYGGPGTDGAPDASWSYDAATLTLRQTDNTAGDSIHGVGGLSNIIHAASNSNIHSGSGNDVFYLVGGTDFTITGGGGTDIAVMATSKPSQAFGVQDRGTDGVDVFMYTGNAGGTNQYQQYIGVAYLEFSDGLYESAKSKYIDPAGFVGLRTAYDSVLRAASSDSAHLAVAQLADKVDAGTLTDASALQTIVQAAVGTSEVATLAYQFFTGRTPGAAGMDYLVAANGPNANNLNSAYYAQFSTTNRYINFASNLGKVGEGAAAFQASYGALSLADATSKAYAAIFGTTPTSDKVGHLLHDAVPDGGSGTYERENYFAAYGLDGLGGQGTKAAMVGWLLGTAAQADLGSFARADDAFLTDVANAKAAFGIDLVGSYAKPEYAYTGG